MKIKNLIFLFSSFLIIASCTQEDLQVTFYASVKEINFVVPATSQAGTINIPAQSMVYNLDSICTVNSTTKDQIKSVKVQEIFLDITDDTTTTTFDFLNWIETYAASPAKPDVMFASLNPNPKEGIKSIGLDKQDVELSEYLKSNQITFYAKAQSGSAVPHDLSMRARVKFKIIAQVAQ